MDLDLTPVTRPPAYALVVSRLEDEIVAGRLRAGDKLPAERTLSEQLGVSRASVREAIRTLQALEIVTTRPGPGPNGGLVMTARPREALATLFRLHVGLASYSVKNLMSVRVGLEMQAASSLLQSDAVDFQVLRDIVTQMDNAELTPAEVQALDSKFHMSMTEYSNNPLIADMMHALGRGISASMLAAFEAQEDWPAFLATIVQEHFEIIDALESGNADAALGCLKDHIEGFYSVLPN